MLVTLAQGDKIASSNQYLRDVPSFRSVGHKCISMRF